MPGETSATTAATEFSKVAAVTFTFWIIKILCTTLGETGADALTQGDEAIHFAGLHYGWGVAIFGSFFLIAVIAQVVAKKFHPLLYWFTIIATTTLGTALADLADRDGSLGYLWGSVLMLALVLATLFIWRMVTGTVAVGTVSAPKTEIFYWVTIMFSQTLGTALGDWFSDPDWVGFGYKYSTAIFAGALVVVALLYFFTKISRTVLFWVAFILTRPLGAALGDLIDKPIEHGGLNISRFAISGVLAAAIALCILIFPHKAAPKEAAH